MASATPNIKAPPLAKTLAKKNKTLPEPEWPETLPNCPGCGYNLMGLTPPLSCPECGFEVDGKTLVLHGVVRSDKSVSKMRRTLWGFTIAAWIIWGLLFEAWAQIIQFGSSNLLAFGAFLLVFLMICIAAIVALVKTSKREGAGSVAIIFTSGGFIAIANLNTAQFEGEIVQWQRVSGLQLKRVSGVWYKLKVWGRGETLLEGGVRCTEELAPLVYDTLNAFRTGSDPPAYSDSSSTTSTQIGPSGVS